MNNKLLSLFAVLALVVAAGIGLRAQNPAGAYTSPAAGGGTPGGSNTQFQFNNNGAFAGSPNLVTTPSGIAVVGVNGQTPTMSIAAPVSGQTVALAVTSAGGSAQPAVTVSNTSGPGIQSTSYNTATNCSSSASPAVCGSAAAGMFILPAAATSVTVNTTAVTANSEIIVFNDDSLGTRLSVTCNTGIDNVLVSARVAATSFTITGSAPVTNPNCYSYLIIN